jgi:hypothetical protein
MENIVFCDVTSCSLQDRYQISGENAASIIKLEDWRNRFLQKLATIYEATRPHIPEATNLYLQFAHIIYLCVSYNSRNKC